MPFMRTSEPERHGPSEGACHLYVLPCAYEDLLKLGFSRDPLSRMRALQPRWFEFFDLDRGMLVDTETVRDARRLELELRRRLLDHSAVAPLTVRREAAGHTEWYRGAYPLLQDEVQRLAVLGHGVRVPLRPWVRERLSREAEGLFAWASAWLDSVEGEPTHLDQPALASQRGRLLDVLDAFGAVGIDVRGQLPTALADWYVRQRL